jgi:hypothetical protein
MEKYCSTCKQTKLCSAFNKNRYRKDGLQVRCRDCDKARSKQRYQGEYKDYYIAKSQETLAARRQWFEDYKKDKCCSRCGDLRWYVLEFHHRDGVDKEDEISRMVFNKRSVDKIMLEIAKCDLVCANCHRELHHMQKQTGGSTPPFRTDGFPPSKN